MPAGPASTLRATSGDSALVSIASPLRQKCRGDGCGMSP